MTTAAAITKLADDAALISAETQQHAHELWGAASWHFDAVTATFTVDTQPPLRYPAHVLGVWAPQTRRWTWAWHRSVHLPAAARAFAAQLATQGRLHAIPELTLPSEALGSARDVTSRVLAAKTLGNQWLHVTIPGEGDTVLWLLIDSAQHPLPKPSVAAVKLALSQALAQGTITNARRSIAAYCAQRKVRLRWFKQREATLTLPDGTITVTLTGHNRIGSVTSTTKRQDREPRRQADTAFAPDAAPATTSQPAKHAAGNAADSSAHDTARGVPGQTAHPSQTQTQTPTPNAAAEPAQHAAEPGGLFGRLFRRKR